MLWVYGQNLKSKVGPRTERVINIFYSKAMAPPNAKFRKHGPTKSSAARENPVFWDAVYAWRVFFATRDSSGYCDWPQNNAEKRSAVK